MLRKPLQTVAIRALTLPAKSQAQTAPAHRDPLGIRDAFPASEPGQRATSAPDVPNDRPYSRFENGRTVIRDLIFTIAGTDELHEAIRFRNETYQEELGHIPTDTYDLKAQHFVAVEPSGRLVATFRMLGPQARPFEFERYVSIDHLLVPTSAPAWVGRLCIDKSHRSLSKSRAIHFSLLRLMLLAAAKYQYSQLILYTGTHLVGFYRLALFQTIAEPFTHPLWGPQQLMFLDLVRTGNRERTGSILNRLLTESIPGNFRP